MLISIDISTMISRYVILQSTDAAENPDGHYFYLQEIIRLLEADIYDKVKSYYSKFIDAELERIRSVDAVFNTLNQRTQRTSRETNYQMFNVSYPSLVEHVM